MLHYITWHEYFAAAFILGLIYYLGLILRCYRTELQKAVSRLKGKKSNDPIPNALKYQEPEETLGYKTEETSTYPQTDVNIGDLVSRVRATINNASAKPHAPAVLIPQLRKILQGIPDIATSPYRQAINELIVRECEKTGTALLTEDEVDQWWGE